MLSTLIITSLLALCVSAMMSFTEAVLYAVPLSVARHQAELGGRGWKLIHGFKLRMGRPIAAILIVNTIANTVGAAIAGATATVVFGEAGLLWFSVLFTLAVLTCGEVIPKVIGVAYCRQVAFIIAYPLYWLTVIFSPLLWLFESVTKRIEGDSPSQSVSSEEVLSIARIAGEEGALDSLEGRIIKNVIGLDEVVVADVLTPRVVVFRIPEDMLLSEVEKEISQWSHSRVPIHTAGDPEHLTGYVTQRDVYRELLLKNHQKRLREISRPLTSLPEVMSTDKLLLHMIEKKEHICAVVDEHGGLAGIVTLEDILEELVGQEILDEYDTITDLRAAARSLRSEARARKGIK